MNWEQHTKTALQLLDCATTPASEALIASIRAVNPTKKPLSPADKERGYDLKNRLQNLLLENYGACFSLVPHPASPDIVLIKHLYLPSVDACHSDLRKLSAKALDMVSTPGVATPSPQSPQKQDTPHRPSRTPDIKYALVTAEQFLDRYDYCQAESLLSAIRVTNRKDIPALLKAARMLSGEMGLIAAAIELLVSQPAAILKDVRVQELLACNHHGNGNLAEARVLFDSLRPEDLGKEALFACADIAFKDGNPAGALHLLDLAERSKGFVTAPPALRADVEAALLAAARPVLAEAAAALDAGDLATAGTLAASALKSYPRCREAREVVTRIENINRERVVATLWQDLQSAPAGAERLRILAKLREVDRTNDNRIAEMVAAENERQTADQIENRIQHLRRCLEQQDWSGCFGVLRSFAAGGKALAEGLEKALSLSPLFSVLQRNDYLDRLPFHQAKRRWLDYVTVKESLTSGRDVSLEVLKELKEYFGGYPTFEEAYEQQLKVEQEKVRHEVRKLLDGEETDYPESARLFGRIRAMTAILPADERAGYSSEMAERLDRLKPAVCVKVPVHEYFEASLLGLTEKAGWLREKVGTDLIAAIDAEVSELFRIDAEPLSLTISNDLPLDLEQPASFAMMGANNKQVLLRDGPDTVILIDLSKSSAVRYRSVLFRGVELCDSLPSSDSFLFLDDFDDSVLRARLSDTECRFTAFFPAHDTFRLHRDDYVIGAFMSSSNDGEYYVFSKDIIDARGATCVKQCLDGTARISKSRSEFIHGVRRLRSAPDGFLLDTSYGEALWNHNLAYKLCITDNEARLFAANSIDHKIYISLNGGVVSCDLDMTNRQLLGEHLANNMIHRAIGFAPGAGVVLVKAAEGKGYFHRIRNGHQSQHFSLARVICTATPSNWYYCDYQSGSGTLLLREVTPETDDYFRWEEVFAAENAEWRTSHFFS